MSVTNEKSVQVTNNDTDPRTPNLPCDQHGRVRVAAFDFTQGASAGDANSKAILADMPSGKVRILELVAQHSAMGAGRYMDFGHNGFTEPDGDVVAADPDFLSADTLVSAAATINERYPDKTVDSGVQWNLTAQVTDATLPAAATIEGWVTYVVD